MVFEAGKQFRKSHIDSGCMEEETDQLHDQFLVEYSIVLMYTFARKERGWTEVSISTKKNNNRKVGNIYKRDIKAIFESGD